MQAKRQIEYIQCEGFWIAGIGGDVLWLPAIASNTSSLPEVVGCDDYLFDPTDPQSIKK